MGYRLVIRYLGRVRIYPICLLKLRGFNLNTPTSST